MLSTQNSREARNIDFGIDPFGIDLPNRGCKDHRASCACECLSVCRECAWVSVIVLIRTKLHGVDEDADNNTIGQLSSPSDKIEVTLMQITHGRDAPNALPACARLIELIA